MLSRRPLRPQSSVAPVCCSTRVGSAYVGLEDTGVTTTTTTSNKGEILSYLLAGAIGFGLGQILRIT